MTCGYNPFLLLENKRPHKKTRGSFGLVRYYNLRMNPMLGKRTFSIHCILCECLPDKNHL